MTDNTIMTDEEAAEAQARLAAYHAAQDEAQKEARRGILQPLIDAGLGTGQITVPTSDLIEAIRNSAASAASLDNSLSNLFISTASVFQTLDDRVRVLWEQNQPAAE